MKNNLMLAIGILSFSPNFVQTPKACDSKKYCILRIVSFKERFANIIKKIRNYFYFLKIFSHKIAFVTL